MLSAHFSLEELTFSEAAQRHGCLNTPDAAQIEHLKMLCAQILEPARTILGCPLHINSGFRSWTVNTIVGGSPKSAHMDGRAADFVPIGLPLRQAFDTLRAGLQGWDQLLIEVNAWLHISIPPAGDLPRLQAMIASGSPGHWVYVNA